MTRVPPKTFREQVLVAGWMLLPAAIMASITLGQVLAALLGTAWLVEHRRQPWRWPAGVRIPILAFFGWVLLAALVMRPYSGDLKDALGKWIFILLLPLAYSQRLDEKSFIRAMYALGAVTLALLPFFIKGYVFSETHRAISLSGGGPNLGSNMMMAAMICAGLALGGAIRPADRTTRWPFVAGAALFAAVLMLSLNRGAILGLGVGLAWLTAHRKPALLPAGLLIGLILMAAFPHARPVERLRSVVRWHESFTSQERVHMWMSGQAMVRDRPLMGFTSRRNFIVCYSTRYRGPNVVETVPGHVHNSVLQTAILHGIPGLGLLCWWLAALWRHGGIRAPGYAAALHPLLLAVFVNAQVDFVIADGQRAMMFYTLCGLLLGTRKK